MAFRRKARVSRDEAFASLPVRNPHVEFERQENGETTLTIRRRQDWWVRLLTLVFFVPKHRKVILDQVGSEIWALCDGQHSVREMVEHVARRYKLNRKEAEISLTTYLRNLGKRNLIAFAVTRPQGGLSNAPSR